MVHSCGSKKNWRCPRADRAEARQWSHNDPAALHASACLAGSPGWDEEAENSRYIGGDQVYIYIYITTRIIVIIIIIVIICILQYIYIRTKLLCSINDLKG